MYTLTEMTSLRWHHWPSRGIHGIYYSQSKPQHFLRWDQQDTCIHAAGAISLSIYHNNVVYQWSVWVACVYRLCHILPRQSVAACMCTEETLYKNHTHQWRARRCHFTQDQYAWGTIIQYIRGTLNQNLPKLNHHYNKAISGEYTTPLTYYIVVTPETPN